MSSLHCPLMINFDQTESFYSSSADPGFHLISFKILYKTCLSEWVITEDSIMPQLLKRTNQPLVETFVVVTHNQFAGREKASEILNEELRDWPFDPDELRQLIDTVLEKAGKMVERMPPHCNSVHLTFRVKALHMHVFNESREVPSIESTIESLERLISSLGD